MGTVTRFYIFLSLFCLIIPLTNAGRGDGYLVSANTVNVRLGPGKQYPVLFTLDKDYEVIELQRHHDWLEIRDAVSGDRTGWIHSSLLNKTGPDKKLVIIHTDADSDPLFELFTLAFEEYNLRTRRNTGNTYFSDVSNPEEGIVELRPTESWLNAGRDIRQQSVMEIFKIWEAAVGEDTPITVEVVDTDGIKLMSQFK